MRLHRLAAAFSAAAAVAALTAGPAAAQTYVGVQPPALGSTDSGIVVLGVQGGNPVVVDDDVLVLGSQGRNPLAAPRSLSTTGADIAELAGLAGLSVGAGALIVRSGRRRRSERSA